MEKQEPPAYTEQPQPGSNFIPASTYTGEPIQQQPQQGYPGAPPTQQGYPGGPTQPPLYPPFVQQPPQPAVTTGAACVIINSTAQHHYIPVGRDPTFVRCPSCKNDVITTIQVIPTTRTHLIALGLCLIGCWLCCCIPYCMNSCKASNHYSPVCNAFIGSRRD